MIATSNQSMIVTVIIPIRKFCISLARAAATSFSKLSIFSLSQGSNSLPRAHVGGSSQAKYPQVSSILQPEKKKRFQHYN